MTIEEFQKEYGIVGKSKVMRDLVDMVMQVAQSDITVLIYGESGTGKEVIARSIHEYSRRAKKGLVSVNCGAIPDGILESELFGHKKGAFTGASEARKGYFEMADQSTLFLDEIGEMPLSTQVKLLRAIENKEFLAVGAETVTKVDVRFIAATNRDLQIMVDSKKFRKDLYFRLKAVTLQIPPLRERRGDIRDLVDLFVERFITTNKLGSVTFTEEAYALLREYNWPGNIRELKNVVETAVSLARDPVITPANIIPFLTIEKEENRALPIPLNKSSEDFEREFIYRALFELKKDILEIKSLLMHKGNEQEKIYVDSSRRNQEDLYSMNELERKTIISVLQKTKGNKRRAAALLDISERTLYRKLKEYDIDDDNIF